ncbi:MAG TPA: TIGR04372 family glycosyltransferase [Xanthobacteraceae bacterium]|nr:TIGR04372 family glycosyltransferase [Xanthobacteraceae bacterium]
MVFRPVKFVLDQARKTARRPGRLFAIPANILLQREHPAAALLCLQPLLKLGRPTIEEYLLGANCLYQGLGRLQDAMGLLTRAGEKSRREAIGLGLADVPYRVLDSVWARHIGHLGIMDYVLKLAILEGRRREETIFYVSPGVRVANRFLVDQIAAHLRLIEDPADLPFPAAAVQALHFDLFAPRLPDQNPMFYWELASQVQQRWAQEGRGPVLRLPPDIEARGRATLNALGMPGDAWLVALHVREREPDGRRSGINSIRNADIASYFPALAEIGRRGGWVVRMGDPGVAPLPKLPHVIDYCRSASRADWMDIFILACSRFLIGTNSGPAFAAGLYGTPAVLANWWPAGERPWHASDIFIPKLLRKISDGSYLTLGETLREPLAWSYSQHYLAKSAGVRVQDSDPEIILAAVQQMLARGDESVSDDAQTARLQARADQIYQSQGVAGSAWLPGEFLRRHESLLV